MTSFSLVHGTRLLSKVTIISFRDLLVGYLACARCSASGKCLYTEPISVNGSYQPLRAPSLKRCANCSGTGKV